VRVVSREPHDKTISCSAGAIWGPHLVTHAQVRGWAEQSLVEFTHLVDREVGVEMVEGIEASRTKVAKPEWLDAVGEYSVCHTDELPAGFEVGWRYTVPVIDMPKYMNYLAAHAGALGVRFEYGVTVAAEELRTLAPVVVNCSGVDARYLAGDPSVFPVKGDLVVVPNPGITQFFAEHTDELRDQTYILPQGDVVVLGGTARPDDLSPDKDAKYAISILERCVAVEPRLAGAPILQHRIGFRPSRPEVRLELENFGRGTGLVHNYGHGGGGVSLSWGCAENVREFVEKLEAER